MKKKQMVFRDGRLFLKTEDDGLSLIGDFDESVIIIIDDKLSTYKVRDDGQVEETNYGMDGEAVHGGTYSLFDFLMEKV